MLGNLLGGFIVILVGVNLLPSVADAVQQAVGPDNGSGTAIATNVTGAASSVITLTTLFFALGVMSSGVALAVGGLRNAGLI